MQCSAPSQVHVGSTKESLNPQTLLEEEENDQWSSGKQGIAPRADTPEHEKCSAKNDAKSKTGKSTKDKKQKEKRKSTKHASKAASDDIYQHYTNDDAHDLHEDQDSAGKSDVRLWRSLVGYESFLQPLYYS